MDRIDDIFLWIKQVVLNINVTFNYVVDFFFSPIYTAVDTIQSVVHQWSTKPNDNAENNNERHIGFQR